MNFHPPLVHFPIVLVLLLVLFEFRNDISISVKSFLSTLLLAVCCLAFYTGLNESNSLEGISEQAQQILGIHYNLGRLALFGSIAIFFSLIFQQKFPEYKVTTARIYRSFLVLLLLAVSIGGYFGGTLVYEHAVGVTVPK